MTDLQRTDLHLVAHEVSLRQARLEVLDDEDRVWKQTVYVEEMRAGGRNVESAQQQLDRFREDLRQARERLRREEAAVTVNRN